jgi:hypothetical protein
VSDCVARPQPQPLLGPSNLPATQGLVALLSSTSTGLGSGRRWHPTMPPPPPFSHHHREQRLAGWPSKAQTHQAEPALASQPLKSGCAGRKIILPMRKRTPLRGRFELVRCTQAAADHLQKRASCC